MTDTAPPAAKPLSAPERARVPKVPGTYKFAAAILRPLLSLNRRHWTGWERLPREGGVIVASNHVSSFDPLTMAHYLYNFHRPPKILAKSGMFRVPILGAVMRGTGQIPVERGTVRAADSLKYAKAALDRGEVIVIFPEGTVTRDPDCWPMTAHPGVAQLAMHSGYPVYPMAQWGGQFLFPRGKALPRLWPRKDMWVEVGDPVSLSDLTLTRDGYREGAERVMAAITGMLAGIRGETPPAIRWDMRKPDGGRGTAAIEGGRPSVPGDGAQELPAGAGMPDGAPGRRVGREAPADDGAGAGSEGS